MQHIPVRAIQTVRESAKAIQSINIRNLSPILETEDLVQELHRHDFYYILLVEQGKGYHEIDFTPYPVNKHALFFMRPGQVHKHCLKQGSKAHIIAFSSLQGPVGQGLLEQAARNNCYLLAPSTFERVHALVNSMCKESAESNYGYELVIKATMETLLVEIIRQQKTSDQKQVRSYEQKKIDEFLSLLNQHIRQYKQVTKYTEFLHLSSYQLNAITKSILGKTPSTVINEHIILEAKRYLSATSNQINQIAEHLGYDDASYFIRFFKKHTGFTPESYRQNCS